MKPSLFQKILALEAIACVLFSLAKASFSGFFSAAIAFPFEQVGLGLRILSLSGGPGNALAIGIYFIIGLSPAAALLLIRKQRKLNGEDSLLVLLSAVLTAVLYLMVNPGMLPSVTGPAAGLTVGKAMLGGMVYSVLFAYLALRVLRLFSAGNRETLQRYMAMMLNLLNVLFVYLAFGACFGTLLDSIESLQSGNVGNAHLLGASYAFLALQFAVNALPYVLNVFIVFAAQKLLIQMQSDRYSTQTVEAAARMSRLCAIALAATVLTNMGFNLLQFLFSKSLMVMNTSVQVPVLSILFVLAALLLTAFAAENKRLKDENDQFI